MLEAELEVIERLYKVAQSRANYKESLVAPSHQREADALGTVLELVRSNAESLHQCPLCCTYFFTTNSKIYCSDKCRVMAFRKK